MFYLVPHAGTCMKVHVASVAEKYITRVSKYIVPLYSNYNFYSAPPWEKVAVLDTINI